jgi:hypothetical protein
MRQSNTCTSLFDGPSSSAESSAALSPSATSSLVDTPIALTSLFERVQQQQRLRRGDAAATRSSSDASSNALESHGLPSWQLRSSFLLPPNAAALSTRECLEMAIADTVSAVRDLDSSHRSLTDDVHQGGDDDFDSLYSVTQSTRSSNSNRHLSRKNRNTTQSPPQ